MAASRKKTTTDKIKHALTEMLDTMPIDDISATALCTHAGINRATFYYHYNSVQDVVEEIEKQVEREFVQWLSQATVTDDASPANSFYVTFFDIVARNVNVCRMLLKNRHNRSDFLARALEAGRIKVVSVMSTLYPNCPASKINFYYMFVSNGFLGLLEYWLNSGMRESITEIAAIGEAVSYKGIEFLKG